jgi:hypothetical protein
MNVKVSLKNRVNLKRYRAKKADSKRRIVPLSLAGKWVAWSLEGKIVASAETLSEVVGLVASKKLKGASYERLPAVCRGC